MTRDSSGAFGGVIEKLRGFFGYVGGGRFRDELMREVCRLLRERTLRGVDARGRRFAGYSRMYRMRKMKAGKYSGRVDLSYSGGMLGSLRGRAIAGAPLRGAIEIGGSGGGRAGSRISAKRLAAIHHEGLGRMPRREFMGWQRGSDENIRLRSHARAVLLSAIKRAGL